jgi:hypothetical protein
MSGEEHGSTETAPVVAVLDDQNRFSLLRDLVGDKETPMGEAEGGSELSEPRSDWEDKRERKEKKKKAEKDKVLGTGRPDFKRATPGTRKKESTQEFFRHGKNGNDDIFDTPKKSVMDGALASALAAAAEKSQKGGTALTLRKLAQPGSKEVGGEEMEGVVGDEWLDETAESRDEGGVSPTPPRFGSPTPSQKRTPVPRPVTPTRGKKRMAVGTPAPVRTWATPGAATSFGQRRRESTRLSQHWKRG